MNTFELSERPDILLDKDTPLEEIRLLGLKFGDSLEKIPTDKIKETNEYGWQICSGGARFRVSNGKIVEFRLSGEIIPKLDISDEDQIETKFGKADKIVHKTYFRNFHIRKYHYFSKHMMIEWSVTWRELTGIILGHQGDENTPFQPI